MFIFLIEIMIITIVIDIIIFIIISSCVNKVHVV